MQAIRSGTQSVQLTPRSFRNTKPSVTEPLKFQGRLFDWELDFEDEYGFSEDAKAEEAATQDQKRPSWGEFARNKVENAMAGLIALLPKHTLWDLESRNLFAGHYRPDLKTSVAEMKQTRPEIGELLDKIEEVRFKSSDNPPVKNYGWYIPAQKGKPTILHSMGNKSSLTSILRYQPLIEDGFGLMSYEYPGYGSTEGQPDEEALYRSAEAASEFLKDKKGIPRQDQIFHGISLGGAVTANLANRMGHAKGIILESTMTSFRDVTKKKVENYAPSWLVPLHQLTCSHMTSMEKLPAVQAPLLVLHGGQDELMPSHFAKKLFDAAGTPTNQKKLVIFKDQGHNIDTGYSVPVIRKFLRDLGAPETEKAR